MLFNSIAFLVFFPLVCVGYFAIPARHIRARNAWLLAASYYFYAHWEPLYALLLLACTLVTYFSGRAMARARTQGARKGWLAACVVLNLLPLFFFKYYDFFAATLEQALQACGMGVRFPHLWLLLPVGISFYVFQAIGYAVDVYKGRVGAERSLLTFALFVSFFPQLVAGPIERSARMLPQYAQEHRLDYDNLMTGLRLMLWGFFLKLVLADRCGLYVDLIYHNLPYHNGGSYLVAAFFFSLQVYGDFAGYSLIAIGTARIMGFRLMENFRRPYLSCTLGEFWQRWHISLSTWFRDYVYIPLGGNRKGSVRCYVNLMVTFLLSALWHGASFTFLCWGAIHGVGVCLERALGLRHRQFKGIGRFFHWLVTLLVVVAAWVFFRAPTLHDAFAVFSGMVSRMGLPHMEIAHFLAIGAALFIWTCKALADEYGWRIRLSSSSLSLWRHLFLILMVAYILLFGVLNGDQFIYFQF